MKRTIIAAVILFALIPTILIGGAVNHYAQTTIKDERLYALTGVVHMVNIHLHRYYDHIILDVRTKAENNGLRQVLLNAEGADGLLPEERDDAMAVLTEYIGFQVLRGAVINADGKTVLATRPEEEGVLMNQTELFRTIMNGKDSYLGLVSADAGTDIVEIAVPIYNDEGSILGILKQSTGLDLLNDYLSNLNLGESGQAFLIRKNGDIIYDNDNEAQVILYHDYQSKNSLEELMTAFKAGRLAKSNGIIEFEEKGIQYIGAYEEVDPISCIAVVAMKKEEIFGSLMRINIVLFVSFLFILILIALSGYIAVYLQVKPLEMMNNTLKKIGSGDLTARCSYKGASEFEELSRNLNSMADRYQKSEKELRMSSRIDSLTRLPNRNAIYELLDTLLYKHPNQALLLLDLDGFKNVNDNLGYDIGDRILMETGEILRSLPQYVCYPSRLGGAEFLVFITNWTVPKYPEKIAEKLIMEIEGIRFIDEIHVDIGASIGIEYIVNERIDKRKLIKHCNIAMYKARNIGGNSYFVHSPYIQKEM